MKVKWNVLWLRLNMIDDGDLRAPAGGMLAMGLLINVKHNLQADLRRGK